MKKQPIQPMPATYLPLLLLFCNEDDSSRAFSAGAVEVPMAVKDLPMLRMVGRRQRHLDPI